MEEHEQRERKDTRGGARRGKYGGRRTRERRRERRTKGENGRRETRNLVAIELIVLREPIKVDGMELNFESQPLRT